MITLSTSGNSVIFTFQDNQHYLQNGTIEVPKNSLMLVTDESNMATFKKSASNDIFISALYSELGMSKSELETWFEENAIGSTGGGGGTVSSAITSGDTNAVAGGAVYDQVTVGGGIEVISSVTASSSYSSVSMPNCNKIAISAPSALGDAITNAGSFIKVYDKTTETLVFSAATVSNMNASYVTVEGTTADTSISFTAVDGYYFGEQSTMYFKVGYDGSRVITFYKDTDTDWLKDVVTAHTENANIHVTANDKQAWSAKQDALSAGTNITISGNVISASNNNKVIELTQAEYDALVSAGTVDNTAFYVITDATAITTTSAVTSASTAVITSGGVYDQLDGLKLAKVTQAEYDLMVSGGTIDNNTLYVIS